MVLQKKLGSSCQRSKELQISKSISVQTGYICDMFSGNRTGIVEVGENGKGRGGNNPG